MSEGVLLTRPHCDLYYEVHGSGPPLVFAHGLGGNHLSWWQQVAEFSARHTCVTFSHRGFAMSPEAPGGPGPRGFADDLAALIDHLRLEQPVLVAQSMGGWTCTQYLAANPGRVRGLVLACTTGAITHPELDDILLAHFRRYAGAAPVLPPDFNPAAGPRMAREQPAMHLLYTQVDRLSANIDKAATVAALLAMRTVPAEAMRLPLLCFTGDEDLMVPPAAVTWLAGHVPGARLHRETAAGHSIYWERPAAFNRALGEFLAGLP